MSVAVMTMLGNGWEKGLTPLFFVRPKIPFVGLFIPSVRPSVGPNRPFIRPMAFLRYSGFTVTELVITLAIAAVLLTLAAPNMRDFIRNNRITTETNTLIAHINLARSEATKRNVVVALCRKNPDPAKQNPPECGGGTAKDWSSGWLVYATSLTSADAFIAAPDYDSARIPPDTLLKDEPTITNGVTVTSDTDGDLRIGYLPSGQLTVAANVTLSYSVCDDRNEAHGKNITILASGRPSLTKTNAAANPSTGCAPG